MTNVAPSGWGQVAPWFTAESPINPTFVFSSLGGRYVLLVFVEKGDDPATYPLLKALEAKAGNLPRRTIAFAVCSHGADKVTPEVDRAFLGRFIFFDETESIARSYGVLQEASDGTRRYRKKWFLLDPTLRIYDSGTLEEGQRLITSMESLPPAKSHAVTDCEPWAPVLVVPRVLDMDLCSRLIEHYHQGVPSSSGFMREADGRTVGVRDGSFKRRMDITIEDEALKTEIRDSISFRLRPMIRRAFQFDASRIERYIVACYGAEDGGFFRAHRDNTTKGTAHRRFAVTINLNAEDYDGGDISFPEFGPRRYRAPTGGAVVFSCSLLHEVDPVTRGNRYATLPFLYDHQSAEIRQQNHASIDLSQIEAPAPLSSAAKDDGGAQPVAGTE